MVDPIKMAKELDYINATATNALLTIFQKMCGLQLSEVDSRDSFAFTVGTMLGFCEALAENIPDDVKMIFETQRSMRKANIKINVEVPARIKPALEVVPEKKGDRS